MAVTRLKPIETLAQRKAERNRRLAESDWTQVSDSPLSAAEKKKWKEYRKELRELDLSGSVEWPLDPKQEKAKPASGKRARNEEGHFKADDPATPEVNEAYEDGKTPQRPKKSRTTKS